MAVTSNEWMAQAESQKLQQTQGAMKSQMTKMWLIYTVFNSNFQKLFQ